MTVEIRELQIKAVIGPPSSNQGGGKSGGSASAKDGEKLVAECVERVMEILERQKDR